MWSFGIGYNHLMSRHSEIGLEYSQTSFGYGALNQNQLYRNLMLAYGYQLTGKLSFQLSGGLGASQVAVPPGGPVTRSFLSTFDSLRYESKKVHAQMIISRSISGGSGVLVGAETESAALDLGRQLSRKISGSLDFGYFHNEQLSQENTLQPLIRYAYWQAGGSLNYEIARYVSVYMNYDLQRQVSNATPACASSNCGTAFFRQVAGMGVNFHARPIKIR
jgi:hypothetical protein